METSIRSIRSIRNGPTGWVRQRASVNGRVIFVWRSLYSAQSAWMEQQRVHKRSLVTSWLQISRCARKQGDQEMSSQSEMPQSSLSHSTWLKMSSACRLCVCAGKQVLVNNLITALLVWVPGHGLHSHDRGRERNSPRWNAVDVCKLQL